MRIRFANAPDDPALSHPITGNAGCCALTAIGHAAAALPKRVMNSLRRIRSPVGTRRIAGVDGARAASNVGNTVVIVPAGGTSAANRYQREIRHALVL